MELKKIKCSSTEHEEIDANSYCGKCQIYMCNKCETFHSKLLKNHKLFILEKDNEDIFTGYCKEENHSDELQFFCKTHNQLCCCACLCKIKKKNLGNHKDCDVYTIVYYWRDKRWEEKQIKRNIKNLEEISKTLEESVNNLKKIFEKINQNKEELKLNIQKIFTKIRNEINNREDNLLLEVDKQFDNLYFKEELIKKSEKLPNKIKLYLKKGKIIEKEDYNDKLNLLINECINIENNIKEVNIINENIRKCNNSNNTRIIFNQKEKDVDNFLENIKSFGRIDVITNNQINNINKIFKSNIIDEENEKIIINLIPNKLISIELIFDTEIDWDSIDDFKNKCHGQGPTLIIIKTNKGIIFGGYNTSKWDKDKQINDNNSFVFSLNPLKKYNLTNPKAALYGYSYEKNIMFQFGCCYFRIVNNCTKNNNNCISGFHYEKGLIDLFKDEDHKFSLKRLEIFKLNF